MDFLKRLGKERLIFDGAMGTMLQASGLKSGELPELWNINHAEAVFNIHKAYVGAGCNILKTNTFGANRFKLKDTSFSVEQVVSAGVANAKRAAREGGEKTGNVCVAMDVGPIGRLIAPIGDLDFEEAVFVFAEMIRAGKDADLILIETMIDTYEIKAAMLAAKENSSLPVVVTFTPDLDGRLITGADIMTAVCLIEGLGADALGFNCGLGPEQMEALLPELLECSSIPLVINPNAGIPEQVNGKAVYRVTPEEFAAGMAKIAPSAQIIGGCCGTTPAHLAAMAASCRNIPIKFPEPKNFTAVSSYGKTVVLRNKTVIIGERLNPTGKPRMKKALQDHDMDYLCREGLAQAESGADILDLNVGFPGIDEAAALAEAVKALQSVTDTPLQIDTANAAAAERALRLYNGKPLLNSVNGKRESLEAILPLVKKYGAAVVALTLDESGIPAGAEGRIRVAEKIIEAAASYGIAKKNIIADTLTMTISTDRDNAKITLEALELARRKLGVHTLLGVSNVSFGLPEREKINIAFFTLAMRSGLSAGIINPLNKTMMDAYYAYRALSGEDENCAGYIERFSKDAASLQSPAGTASAAGTAAKTQVSSPAPNEMNLYEAVLSGLREQAGKAASAMIASTPPLDIINNHLIPALNKAGDDFGNRKIFLPQLLMTAESAKAAFQVIKDFMSKHGRAEEKRGKIVLATVKGDIHDIGKNIVKILLENYNFEVIDLGKNVEPDLVLETVLKEKAALAGLSALMTTTVVYMEETIRILKEKAPYCRVMVGGAVLSEEYSNKIGADYYSKDALGGVHYAEELLGK